MSLSPSNCHTHKTKHWEVCILLTWPGFLMLAQRNWNTGYPVFIKFPGSDMLFFTHWELLLLSFFILPDLSMSNQEFASQDLCLLIWVFWEAVPRLTSQRPASPDAINNCHPSCPTPASYSFLDFTYRHSHSFSFHTNLHIPITNFSTTTWDPHEIA